MAANESVADKIEALPSGAIFYRADLHIHSHAASHDVRDAAATPEAIVDLAIAERLGLIAITDHNEVGNILAALAASAGRPIFILPGVELTTPEGHLLVYFETIDALTRYVASLNIVGRGTPESRCQTSMLECLNRLNGQPAFAILAHVDGDGGLEERIPGYPPHKADILKHPLLLAIELRTADSDISYGPGDPVVERVRIGAARSTELSLGTRQSSIARVVFSDSHTPAALGRNAKGDRRVTRFKMDTPSFHGIRIALQDADARVRLEEQIPQSIPYVMGFTIEGGFLDGQMVHFSRNLNCLIGGRGAGKSTVLEAVRSLAPHASKSRLVDSEVWPDLAQLVWCDEAGQRHTINRRKGNEPENSADPDFGPVTFPVECYGQGETAQTSQQAQADPTVLLAFLDQFVDIAAQKKLEHELRDALLENRTEIEKAEREVARIPEFQRALVTTQQQLQAIEKAKATEIVALERKVAEERSLRETIERKVAELPGQVKRASAAALLVEVRTLTTPQQLSVGADHYKTIVALAAALEEETNQADATVLARIQAFALRVRDELTGWKARERQIVEQIEAKRKELAAQGVKLDLAYIRKLASDEATYAKSVANLKSWVPHLTELKAKRIELLGQLRSARGSITATRVAYAGRASETLAQVLADLTVSVKFAADALSPAAQELIQEVMGWRTVQVPRAPMLVEELGVNRLVDIARRKDIQPLLALTTPTPDKTKLFSAAEARDIISRLSDPPTLYRLERCEVEDRPRITVTKKIVTPDGKQRALSRDFGKLSLGQQQSVLLSLMASSDSTAPLIVDQPEDNLDGEFVYHSLVPVLRQAKERRQVIVVTHNANIAVLGDAEQIICLKSMSDRGQIVARGSIDDPSTRVTACQILEGAEEAFRRRAQIYGITK